ncbi:AfsR/SARP family transcriptional regulator [Kutzneria sp. CA-103260]|uniref:AfsR/SARP family transcriptional regulator n=1 Tax=Kutzneria sp. CA-103260 TaxID=2802641 RepID=UPI001BADB10B|nr:BTAD domain-containing putative transcriptional regulator [Kutzneria sp. CA-103260]
MLGPLEVGYNGVAVTVGAARQRTLLAVLLMHANQVVSLDELVRNVWEEHPTAGARTTVQNYVMRLRNALRGVAGTSPIVTASDGYLIAVDESELDVGRFRQLVEQARGSEPEMAAKLLTDALSLWRGDPLADVQSETLRREVVPRLTEQLLSAAELRFDVELGLGRHNGIIGELRDFTARNPLRERFWAQLITALYRSGRQAEALQAFQDVRAVLADELGIDPGPELLELHRQVLAGDPALAALTTRQPLPRQLPPPVGGFVGRAAELDALDQLLDRQPAIAVISAGGGFGKTSLVLRWAHDRIDRFPDGQLFVNLRGFDPAGPPMRTDSAVRGLLEAFGVTSVAVPAEPEAQAALYRSLVADKRMLIVLDNASDSNQVAPLLPGSATCTVMVTSRNQLSGLLISHQATHLALDVLSDHEAYELLTAHLSTRRVLAEPAAVADLVRLCAGLPLALNIVAARAAIHPDFPLATLAAELSDARLDALDAGELSANLRAVFACSYNALGSAAAEVFGLLGLTTGPDISLPAAASLTGLPAQRVRNLLRELENSHLVSEHVPGRYRMHDLVRLYAAERGMPGPVRRAAITRLLDFYLHTAHCGELRLYEQHAQPIQLLPPEPGAQPLTLADHKAATAWFDAEYANLVATMRNAVQQERHRAVWGLAWSMNSYHWRRSRLTEDLAFWRAALTATEAIGEHVLIARRFLGRALTRVGTYPEALEQLTLAAENDDPYERAHAFHTLAWYWERSGDDEAALAAAKRGLALFRQVGSWAISFKALNAVGYYQARLGQYEQARQSCEQAVELARDLNPEVVYGLYDSLGFIAYSLGDDEAAQGYFLHALTLIRQMGNIYEEPNIQVHLGLISQRMGNRDAARLTWLEARQSYAAQARRNDVERVQRLLDALDGD